jgi:hypothetical protein
LQFFKIFRDQKDTAHVKSEIDRLKKRLLASGQIAEERISPILAILDQLDSLASE